MTRDEIISHPCRVLTSEQREGYYTSIFADQQGEARADGAAAVAQVRTRVPAGS